MPSVAADESGKFLVTYLDRRMNTSDAYQYYGEYATLMNANATVASAAVQIATEVGDGVMFVGDYHAVRRFPYPDGNRWNVVWSAGQENGSTFTFIQPESYSNSFFQ